MKNGKICTWYSYLIVSHGQQLCSEAEHFNLGITNTVAVYSIILHSTWNYIIIWDIVMHLLKKGEYGQGMLLPLRHVMHSVQQMSPQ